MRADRPARLLQCEIVAAWRGYRLVANNDLWDLVPTGTRPAIVDDQIIQVPHPTPKFGLTVRDVEDSLGLPRMWDLPLGRAAANGEA